MKMGQPRYVKILGEPFGTSQKVADHFGKDMRDCIHLRLIIEEQPPLNNSNLW